MPGKPAESQLLARLDSTDPDEVMPPPATKKKATAAQKAILKKWIESGAEYQAHWAFIPPKKPELPAVKNADWVRNPIDAFIASEHEAHMPMGMYLVMFLVGVYGGYFGAAQGIILISVLGILVDDGLQHLNATKNVLALTVNGVAAIVFVATTEVNWAATPDPARAAASVGVQARITCCSTAPWARLTKPIKPIVTDRPTEMAYRIIP